MAYPQKQILPPLLWILLILYYYYSHFQEGCCKYLRREINRPTCTLRGKITQSVCWNHSFYCHHSPSLLYSQYHLQICLISTAFYCQLILGPQACEDPMLHEHLKSIVVVSGCCYWQTGQLDENSVPPSLMPISALLAPLGDTKGCTCHPKTACIPAVWTHGHSCGHPEMATAIMLPRESPPQLLRPCGEKPLA